DPVDREVEVVDLDPLELRAEHFPRAGEEMRLESAAFPDEVLPEPGLRLVHADRHLLAHRRPVVLGIEPLLVEAMLDLVEDREQPLAEAPRVEARGDPAVARSDAGRERVCAHVEAPAIEVEAHRGGDLLAERALALDREVALEDRDARLLRRTRD